MMLLSHRPAALKFLGVATLLTVCAVLLFYSSWNLNNPWPNAPAQSSPPADPLSAPPIDSGIPKKIWYKLGPHGVSDEIREWTDSCIKSNPNYHAEFLTDASADAYVARAFASRPDIVNTYLNLSIPILKADLLRYLLLYAEGGVWFDLDVSCEEIPIDEWIPTEYRGNVSVVAGWEFDVGWGENFLREFATWTIMARPASPHMLMVIDDIVDFLKEKRTEYDVSVAKLTLHDLGDVVDATGPRRFTSGVLKSLERSLNESLPTKEMENLMEPKLVGDLLVMPGYSFAMSSNKYGEKEGELGQVLVEHHYAGTWKNEFGGEQP